MKQTQTIKRRRVPRRDFQRLIGVLIKGEFFITDGLQIGEGGMLFLSPQKLTIGQTVVLSFRLPQQNFAVLRAVVRYEMDGDKGPWRYGAEFYEVDFLMKRAIRQYVAVTATSTAGVKTENPRAS